jgi:hypothetical protein
VIRSAQEVLSLYRFARIVLGYHGCLEPIASELLGGRLAIDKWCPSKNRYDWLGQGIYFWEHDPERALRWAQEKAQREEEKTGKCYTPAVVGAIIQLGQCLDLTQVMFTELLAKSYEMLEVDLASVGKKIPLNKGMDLKARERDCAVVNACIAYMAKKRRRFQTVRAPFLEGEEAFPGASFRVESHVQLAVRDKDCILGIFRPQLK